MPTYLPYFILSLNDIPPTPNLDCNAIETILPILSLEIFVIGPPTQSAFVIRNCSRHFSRKSQQKSKTITVFSRFFWKNFSK